MRRKLIKQGINGLTIYLPQNWIKERSLKNGDEVNIEPNEERLLIYSDKSKKKNTIEIKIENESKEFIRNYLNQLYISGYDTIKVISRDKERLLLCQKFTQMFLLGFEVVDKGENFCVIENISEPDSEKKEAVLRRIFLLIQESLEILNKDLIEGIVNNREDINRNTKKVTQYDNFYKRELTKQNLAFGNQFFIWETLNILSLIEHNLFHLYDKLSKKTIKNKIFTEYSGRILSNFNKIYLAFYKKDLRELDSIQKESNNLFEKIQKLNKNIPIDESILLYYIIEAARLQYLLCTPIISLLSSPKTRD